MLSVVLLAQTCLLAHRVLFQQEGEVPLPTVAISDKSIESLRSDIKEAGKFSENVRE